MKKTLAILGLILSFSFVLNAQKKAPVQPVGCLDPLVRQQADLIKQHYVSQGFMVYRDAMINMQSMVPFPVMVQFNKGQLYQIVFVGQTEATTHKLVIYDGGDNIIDERSVSKKHGDEVTNFIVYEFIPDRTDTYLLTFMTRLKNRDFCGSVCILAADRNKKELKYTPYVP